MSDETPIEPGLVGTATVAPPREKPRRSDPKPLPPWRVLLHNDDVNDFDFVIVTIEMLTPLKRVDAARHALDAHMRGVTLLLTTHKERAELYKDQFASRGLTVTIEPTEG